jgi:hypothetical protein
MFFFSFLNFKIVFFFKGHRGKGEYMCIGGAWSPSLDGSNPLDPITLVKTAIRTTLAMTGLDLGDCSKWYVNFFFYNKIKKYI